MIPAGAGLHSTHFLTVVSLARKDQLGLFGPRSKPSAHEGAGGPVTDGEQAGVAPESALPKAKGVAKPSQSALPTEPPPEMSAALSDEGGGADFSSESVRRLFAPRPEPAEKMLFPGEAARRRSEMPFSRRMSDLIRRLQLLEREVKADVGVTLPQAHAIHSLMDAGSLRMQELAADLGLAQSTVTRLVTPLKRMGLLDRRPDGNDGRATRAFLTEKGMVLVDALLGVDRELYDGLLARLPENRRAEVVAAIALLHEAVLEVTSE